MLEGFKNKQTLLIIAVSLLVFLIIDFFAPYLEERFLFHILPDFPIVIILSVVIGSLLILFLRQKNK